MKGRDQGGYDAGYKSCSCFWGCEPGSYVRKLVALLGGCSGLRVLDAGCGEGKNAAFLSALGARVTAIDISGVALDHARRLHPEASVEWLEGDIVERVLTVDYYDVVLAYGLFHCLRCETEIINIHERFARSTRAGGYHVICAFNDRDHDLSAHPDFEPCLLPHSFYSNLYSEWHIEDLSDETLHEEHPHNRIPHHHSLTRILARKRS
ncbi:class I SAM-dependent methyltransferase [Bradyrhizobium sp. BR 10289]|uniref:class I SAM-dependent methyltransferase n=1 Tax=Bradyrhizobium sp. BR 10289 TaxID=2749993 RepID=UPI001C64FD42|nr:class I SAM-dependent methyltransferase [Bradyrhizobium sp. BR 10289]MBW7973459.1 class I SAM-dependent methyltransferase [Bradyrhizobium sp. BR 10289]